MCVGTKYPTYLAAVENCLPYCTVDWCDECKAWHVVQKGGNEVEEEKTNNDKC